MTRWLLALAALAAAVFVVAPAFATTIEALDMRALVERSDRVLLGTVVRQEARWDDRHRIVTDVTVRVEDAMKGDAAVGHEVVVRCLGGAIGDLGMHIEGEPSFEDGDRAIVFGRAIRGAAYVRPVGMSQGVLPIRTLEGREMVLPGGRGLALVSRAQGGRLLAAPAALLAPRPLPDVVAEIRAHVAATVGP